MNSAKKLIAEHLDSELSDDAFRRLQDWLREGPANIRQFASQWLIHSMLFDVVNERRVQADALLRTVTAHRNKQLPLPRVVERASARSQFEALHTSANSPKASPAWRPLGRVTHPRYRLVAGAIAVVLFFLAGSWLVLMSRAKVAMLTQTASCRWKDGSDRIVEGAQFRRGDKLHLLEGRAQVAFVSGARLLIEGPTELTIESETEASMRQGTLTSYVPTQAVGFSVNTPAARLIDLGTEFTTRVGADKSFELHVFEGLVELHLAAQEGTPAEAPLRLSEGVAVKVNPDAGSVQAIPYDVTQRMQMP